MKKIDLIQAGYDDKGETQCPKCQQTVQKFENDLGKKVFLNLDTHPERPGWLHSLGCNKDPEAEFMRDSIPEPSAAV